MTTPEPNDPGQQIMWRCTRGLHIDWEGDPVPVREDIARCELPAGHPRRHEATDKHGQWWAW